MELCNGEKNRGSTDIVKTNKQKKQPLNLDLYPFMGQWRSILAGAGILERFQCQKMQKKVIIMKFSGKQFSNCNFLLSASTEIPIRSQSACLSAQLP